MERLVSRCAFQSRFRLIKDKKLFDQNKRWFTPSPDGNGGGSTETSRLGYEKRGQHVTVLPPKKSSLRNLFIPVQVCGFLDEEFMAPIPEAFLEPDVGVLGILRGIEGDTLPCAEDQDVAFNLELIDVALFLGNLVDLSGVDVLECHTGSLVVRNDFQRLDDCVDTGAVGTKVGRHANGQAFPRHGGLDGLEPFTECEASQVKRSVPASERMDDREVSVAVVGSDRHIRDDDSSDRKMIFRKHNYLTEGGMVVRLPKDKRSIPEREGKGASGLAASSN